MRRVAAGNPLDQWMTPEWAAALLVERYFGGLGPRDRVLEPAAGRGAFLKAIPEQADAVGVEIDPALAAAAEADTGRRVITGDFRTVRLPWDPTAIVGNPPFDVRLLEALLRRAEGWLPDDGLCGLLLPAYALQNHRRVVRWAETWGLASDMVPRGLFPDLRLPLVFVRFRKGRIRTMLGFALYREAAEVDRLSAASRLALVAGAPRRGVWRALVEEALGRLGGEAPLEAIYEAVEPRRPGRRGEAGRRGGGEDRQGPDGRRVRAGGDLLRRGLRGGDPVGPDAEGRADAGRSARRRRGRRGTALGQLSEPGGVLTATTNRRDGMEPGAVIRLTHFQHHHRAAQISATYKAPKGKVFVALVLGVEEKDGSQEFDPNRALESLGWRFEGGEAGR